MLLAYDQGIEHGPADFNERNYNPQYILDIGREGKFTCVALQYGIASRFWKDKYEDLPLVIKMNGKTKLGQEVYSTANCTVAEAVDLGASAVGYTIYPGSEHEPEMFKEFSQLREDAHAAGIPIIAWVYPALTPPNFNDDEREPDIVAYAARLAAELGADAAKIKFPHDAAKLDWIVKNALGITLLMSGGDKESDEQFLEKVRTFLAAGGDGIAVGRNIWQNEKPLEIAAKLRQVVGV